MFAWKTDGECNDNNLYRIIGVIPTQSSENGEYENRVKLIKANVLGYKYWSGSDNNQSNDWTKSTLNTKILNEEYWNSINKYQKYIEDSKWYLASSPYNVKTNEFYENERGNTVNNDRPVSWIGKIGLMHPSDYGYAVGGANRTTCLEMKVGQYNTNDCYTNDWLFIGYEWTLNPVENYLDSIIILANGSSTINLVHVATNAYRPVFYLNSLVLLKSGSGQKNDPYRITFNE